jgi:hypothetical protein
MFNNNTHPPLVVGKWYAASYGYTTVIGKCIAPFRYGGGILSFRWGTPFRKAHSVDGNRILAEVPDPRLFDLIVGISWLTTQFKSLIIRFLRKDRP